MRVVAAPDKFRGTASAAEIADAIASAAASLGVECDVVPLADGGEGTLAAFGGANRTSVVTGPLGEPVTARWQLRGAVAVIEMAQASGLALVGGAEGNDAMNATSAGTGELIAEAVAAGAQRVLVGLGGSASTDGGLGAVRALSKARLRGVSLEVLCDVRTRFVDAAEQFAPQKGASEAEVAMLRRRLERLVEVYRDEHGVDVADAVGAGAAGGLAGGLAAVGGVLRDGLAAIADEIDLYGTVEGADLVVTGEGCFDASSLQGKVVDGVGRLATAAGVRALGVVGSIGADAPESGLWRLVDLSGRFGREVSMADPARLVAEVVGEVLVELSGELSAEQN